MIEKEETMEPLMNRTKSNYLYQVLKSILILEIECDIIASPWDYEKTLDWYKKEYGYDETDNLNVKYVDIRNEGMWDEISDEDDDFESLSYLFYIKDFEELIIKDRKNQFDNVRIIDGNLCRYISFENYCDKYLKSGRNMQKPEIIASTEY